MERDTQLLELQAQVDSLQEENSGLTEAYDSLFGR
jgi:hypothetical protein